MEIKYETAKRFATVQVSYLACGCELQTQESRQTGGVKW